MAIFFTLAFVLFFLSAFSKVSADLSQIYRNLEDASQKCQDEFGKLSPEVALKMLDSSTKIPEGVLSGRMFQLGEYDECYDIDESDGISGKYCLGILNVAIGGARQLQKPPIETFEQRASNPVQLSLHMAYCAPSGCSAKDLTKMTTPIVTDVINGSLVFDETYCYSRATDPDLSGGAIATISILSVFGAIALVSTLYDLKLYYTKQKVPHDLLTAFSAFSNGKKLIASTSNPDQLLCLNGIKAISMAWVLAGHVYQNSLDGPLFATTIVEDYKEDPANQFLIGATVAVDTFFLVAGVVIVYVFLKSMDKGVKFNIVMFYVHRYIRLTPIFGIVILVEATVIEYMGNGPYWGFIPYTLVDDCKEHWWSALLYIQNYAHGPNNCVPQSWYLSVDFQLFLLSPLVLIPLHRWRKFGLALIGVLILGGVIIPFAIGFHYKLSVYRSTQDEVMYQYYKMTHTRYGPYVIGMLVGYFIYQVKSNKMKLPRLNSVTVILAWLISLTGLVGCVWGPAVVHEYQQWGSALKMAFLSNAWAVSLGGVVFLCVTGYGGPIDWFLSLPLFQFLSKVSYSMYLVHYQFIVMRYASSRVNIRFSHKDLLWSFWGDFMLSLAVATVLTLVFESPIIILEKFLFGGGGKKRPKTNEMSPNDPKKLAEA